MDSEEIKVRLLPIIVEKLNVSSEEVIPSAHFSNDLGADSLDQVELVMELEKEFNLHIDDEQAAALQTVGNVMEYLEKALNK
ncbi:MAG: acyl carrier protein [Amoebophilaceae bacterium]|nr:acyl carrier protein [Amoebophilaceae bacterium]